ncbi:MAG: CDP-diacylglycerol--serine O-phosphatidyltransferase [Steroidobacteraceae bacterium]|nr:CDP-diacylglycerol--serine O-phosphatidyltransferase [Steroidobacteraceae bacterium]
MIAPDDDTASQDGLQTAPPVRPRRRGIYLLPNLLTTGTLFAGFYAIVAAIDHNFDRAAIAVFGAMLFDGLDGRIARWTRTESTFGKEYDSLCDMVAFGLAPAIVVYQWGVAAIAEYNATWGRIGWLVTFFYAVAAALRLARFNARTAVVDKRFFEGLPSPSAAAIVAAFIWCAAEYGIGGFGGLVAAFAVTATAGVLMVSRFYYSSFKGFRLTGRVRYGYALIVPLTFVIIAANPPVVLLTLFGAFAASAPLAWLWRRARRRPPPGAAEPPGAGARRQ